LKEPANAKAFAGFCLRKSKLGFIVLMHEMQNAKYRMQNYDSLPFLHGNEPGEPNGVEIFAGLKARGVSGDSPLN
jgi:hypothetical protein